MTAVSARVPTSTVPHSTAPGEVRVWDRFVRLFHWSLVATVAGAAVTGFLAPTRFFTVHLVAGTTVAALVFARLVWGFVGSRHARFADFVVGPAEAVGHLRALARTDGRHLGHDPLGGWMILALLAVLTALVATGLLVLGGQFRIGPLAFVADFAAGIGARRIHESLAVGLLVLVGLHLAGVLYESLRTRENLARAMITGRKRPEPGTGTMAPVAARSMLAAAVIAAGVVGAAVLVADLSARPVRGLPPTAIDPLAASECGACHFAYPPSLLPRRSWAALFDRLGDHFGEDASLPEDRARRLAAFYTSGAAETVDTEAGNRLRRVDPAEPLRITATPFWKWRHAEIPDAVFAAAPVGGRGNCGACHADATAGRFLPTAIAVPSLTPPKGSSP